MDPRNRADEALARAQARGGFVVTPDNATSPMDAESTVRFTWDGAGVYVEPATTPQHQLPQQHEQQSTRPTHQHHTRVPGQFPPQPQPSSADRPAHSPNGPPAASQPQSQFLDARSAHEQPPNWQPEWPEDDPGNAQTPPVNPYQAQRAPGEFGPLGSQRDQRSQ